ncbi:MAG: hypothetical protein IPK19_42515 [Chloroflexi bacterium]|nr:hypothetical protein [Chloroflexota bacterium]
MRRFSILIGLVLLLLIGGGLTALLNTSDGQVLPILQQVGAPDASPTLMLPWKANQFIIMIGFILFNLVGMAVTLAIVLWFVDRGVRKSRAEAKTGGGSAGDESPA